MPSTIRKHDDEKQKMEFNTPWERMKIQEGVQQGTQASFLPFLAARFGPSALSVSERLQAVQDTDVLKALCKQAATVSSLEEFQNSPPTL